MSRSARENSWGSFAKRAMGLGAGFIAICSLIDTASAVMTDAQKDEIRAQLGDYFDRCMEVTTHFAFCAVQAYTQREFGLPLQGEPYDCSGNTSPAGLMELHGFTGNRAACEAAMQPQGPIHRRLCARDETGEHCVRLRP